MSRIQFSAPIEEIIGTLAGSVFQDSYMGIQIRTRVSPANPQTYYQQLRRGEFGYLSATWRSLSAPDLATWLAAAGTLPSAFRLYLGCNINLTLIGENPISSFTPSATPGAMAVQFSDYDDATMEIIAVSSPSTVPAGHSLLVFVTAEKAPTKVFTNPSQYSPVVTFAAASGLAAPTSIRAEWIARYGQVTPAKRICLKSVLINTTNGLRGAETINCAVNPFVAVDSLIDSDGTFIVNSDGTFITFP